MLPAQHQGMTIKFFVFFVSVGACLIVSGFLITPSMFHFVNFEYQRYVPQLEQRIAALNEQILVIRKDARTLISNGNKLGLSLTLRSESSYSRRSKYASESASAFASSSAEMKKSLSQEELNAYKRKDEIKTQFYSLQTELDNAYEDLEEINKEIGKYSTESNNAYLVTRALALGALGALITVLGRGLLLPNSDKDLVRYSARDLTASLLIGAIVSVVAIGLFYTKQITIFKSAENSSELPDYWRTTILCLIAGAFAERLFKAASDRVSQYVGDRAESNSAKQN